MPTSTQSPLSELNTHITKNYLLPYFENEAPDAIKAHALKLFWPEKLSDEIDRQEIFHGLFMPWFLYCACQFDGPKDNQYDSDDTLTENYLRKNGQHLSSAEKAHFAKLSSCAFSFHQVLEVKPGIGMKTKDILTDKKVWVDEHKGSFQIKAGNILFAMMLTQKNYTIMLANAYILFSKRELIHILQFKDWLTQESKHKKLSALDIWKFDRVIFDFFFDLLNLIFTEPTLVNGDGDEVELCHVCFDLAIPMAAAAEKLQSVNLRLDLPQDGETFERDASGKLTRVILPLIKDTKKKRADRNEHIIGSVIIEQGKLVFQADSKNRLKLGCRLLKKHLGSAITSQKKHDGLYQTHFEKKPSRVLTPDEISSPEMQAGIQAFLETYWQEWLDKPIPALDDQTPRQAAKTKSGRALLEALFAMYQSGEDDNNLFAPDVPALRKALNMRKPRK